MPLPDRRGQVDGAFRAAFEPIAREVVIVDTGALRSEIYTPELFTRVRRPVYPLDRITDPRAR